MPEAYQSLFTMFFSVSKTKGTIQGLFLSSFKTSDFSEKGVSLIMQGVDWMNIAIFKWLQRGTYLLLLTAIMHSLKSVWFLLILLL